MAGFRFEEILKVYGRPKESGRWWIDINRFEEYVANNLKPLNFGESVKNFRFGFEMATDIDGDSFFTPLSNYVSYRPKVKELISVGQIDYAEVKNRRPKAQLLRLAKALNEAAARVEHMKRRPRAFDYRSFVATVANIARACPLDQVAWTNVA